MLSNLGQERHSWGPDYRTVMCEMNGNFLAEEAKNMLKGKKKKTEEKEVAYSIARIQCNAM